VKRRRFKLGLESLEDRTVPAGQAFVEPPVISSVNGVLTTTLISDTGSIVLDPIGYNGFEAIGGTLIGNADTYQVQGTARGLFPGPTLHADPGDVLDITIVNNLENPTGNSSAYGPTNLHVHGLHVSALGNSDNVFLNLEPGESNRYRIQIPENHPQGLYWYHPHRHEFTDAQVWGGLAGLLIIGRPDSGASELDGLTQHTMAIRSFQLDAAGQNLVDKTAIDVTQSQWAVNGQINPTISVQPGESQVWNIANIGNDNFQALVVTDTATGQNLPLYVVSQDGNPLTKPKQVDVVDLGPGRRASFIVQFPQGAASGSTFELRTLPYFSGFNQWPVGSPTQSVTLATASVSGAAATPFTIPPQLTPPANLFHDLRNEPVAQERTLIFNQGFDPQQGKFIFTVNGKQFPDVPFIQARLNTVEEWTLINPTVDIHPFHIHQNGFQIISVNDIPLDPNGPPITVTVNTSATGVTTHETYVGGGITDVVDIPAMNPVTGEPGKVVIRMKFEDFIGHYVYHCHILGHEDLGMMGIVNVVPEHPSYAVGQNPGQPAKVTVYGSDENMMMAEFFPFAADDTQGLNTAVGDVNGDGVYDIIVGHMGDTRVRVIDGTMLHMVDSAGVIMPEALLGDFFAFGASRPGGVTVAAGDVNSDGLADIIVGAGEGTTSRVRAVDATMLDDVNNLQEINQTALLVKFMAFESSFKGGVSVACGDINGDGRIDIVAGSGAGRRAEVKVVDGNMLNDTASDGLILPEALLGTILPFDNSYTAGLNVASGILKGFGFNDVALSAKGGDYSRVAAYFLDGHHTGMAGAPEFAKLIEFSPYPAGGPRGTGVTVGNVADSDSLVVYPIAGNANRTKVFDLSLNPHPPMNGPAPPHSGMDMGMDM
jgi:FtsP/CotA-like multicopper oxidase with cupredoxin domain